jgi:hypothetical protein
LASIIVGVVIEFPPGDPPVPLTVNLAAVDAMTALTNPNPTHLSEASSDADGAYRTTCMDWTNVAIAVLMLVDDEGFDGVVGDYFPAYTPVVTFESNQDKTCSFSDETPPVFGVPNTLVTALSQEPALAGVVEGGFAIVLVTDHEDNPVEGAVISYGDGSELDAVVYPDADLATIDGIATSEGGVALVPGPMPVSEITAGKDGMTWEAVQVGIVPGFCLVRPLAADPP